MNSGNRKLSNQVKNMTKKIPDYNILNSLSSSEFISEIMSLFKGIELKESPKMIIIDEFHGFYNHNHSDKEYQPLITKKIFEGFIKNDDFSFRYSHDETLLRIREIYSRLNFMNRTDSEYFIQFLLDNKETQPLFMDMLKSFNHSKENTFDPFLGVLYLLDYKDRAFSNSVFEHIMKNSQNDIIINRENDFLNSIIFVNDNPEYAEKLKSISVNTAYAYSGNISNSRNLLNNINFYDIPDIFKDNNKACFIKFYTDHTKLLSLSQRSYIVELMDENEVIDSIVKMVESCEYDKDMIISIASDFKEKIKDIGIKNLYNYICYYHSDVDNIYYSLYPENQNSLFRNISDSITVEDFANHLCGFIYTFIESEYLRDSLNSVKDESSILPNKKRI